MMPNQLEDLVLDENSLVDVGASAEAKVLIYKRHVPVEKMNPTAGALHAEGVIDVEEEKKRRKFSTKEKNPRSIPVTNEGEDEMSDKISVDDLPEEVVKYIADLEAYTDSLEANVSKGHPFDVDEDDEEDDEEEQDEVEKSAFMSEEIAKREAAEARLVEVEKALEAEKDRRLTDEFTAVAKSYNVLPTDSSTDEFAQVLKSLSLKAPEEYEVIKGILDKSESLIEQGGAFTELGKSFAGSTEIGGRAEAMARDLVEKNLAPDIETARTKVFEDNPEIYDQLTSS